MVRSETVFPETALELARRLLALAEEQRAAAEAGDWIRALECADQRTGVLTAICRVDPAVLDADEHAAMVDILIRVQAHDEETAKLVRHARQVTLLALSELDCSQAMARSYRRSTIAQRRALLVDDEA